jgi:hypothetical protein
MRNIDRSDLLPGMDVAVCGRPGRVTAIADDPKHGTVVHYRDGRNGAIRVALLEDVKIEKQKCNLRGVKFVRNI